MQIEAQTKMFPILRDPVIRAIPWEVIRDHERQAQSNHYQSLSRLAERGGLSVVEAVAILLDIPFPPKFQASQIPEYRHILMRIIRDFEPVRALESSHED